MLKSTRREKGFCKLLVIDTDIFKMAHIFIWLEVTSENSFLRLYILVNIIFHVAKEWLDYCEESFSHKLHKFLCCLLLCPRISCHLRKIDRHLTSLVLFVSSITPMLMTKRIGFVVRSKLGIFKLLFHNIVKRILTLSILIYIFSFGNLGRGTFSSFFPNDGV